jgi:hypothetical protein
VRYSEAESQIRTGDMLLFRGAGPVSRFIQRWTCSRYSHAGVAVWVPANGYKRLCVMEALWLHGVRLFPLDLYVKERGWQSDWFTVTDPQVNREAVGSYVLKQLGKRYVSFGQMLLSFGWATRWLRNFLGLPLSRDLDPDRFFCSELCAEALYYAGYDAAGADKVPAVEADPGCLALFPCLQRRGTLEP